MTRSRRRPGVEPAFRPPEGWRVGLAALSAADFFGDTSMLRTFTEVVQPLVRSATVRTVDLTPLLEAGSLLYHGPRAAERLSGLAGFLERAADALLPITRHILESGRGFLLLAAVCLAFALRRATPLGHTAELTALEGLVEPDSQGAGGSIELSEQSATGTALADATPATSGR